MERCEILRKRWVKGKREADELDKEQKQRDGENKRFSACPRSAATARRQAKAVATVSTNLEFKGHRILLLFPFTM